jgi:hypothetical protein
MRICPNKNTDYYRDLVAKHGEDAPMIWFNEEIIRLAEEDEKPIINNNKGKEFIDNLAKDNYLFTHVTTEANAKSIIDNGIKISQGTGISSTLSVLDGKSVNSQIERLQNGEVVHRDLTNDSVAIIAIPKNLLDSIQGKDKAEKLEEWLMENDFANDGKYNIPTKFNIGYLGKEGLIQNNTVKSESNNKNIDLIAKTQIKEEILKEQVDNIEEDILNYDNFGDIVIENSDKLFAKKSDVKIVKLKAKIPTLKQVRKAVSKISANKSINIVTNEEQKRLYNIQKVDIRGNFISNDFFDIKVQNDVVDSVFSLSYQAVLKKPISEREKLKEEDLIDEVLSNIDYIYNILIDIEQNNLGAEIVANTNKYLANEQLTPKELEQVEVYGYMPYIDIFEDIFTAKEQVKKFTLQKFNNLKLDFRKLKEELDVNDDETNDRTEYIANEERDPKETMSDRVKLFISTATQYKYNTITGKTEALKNKIGFEQIVDNSIYEKMLQLFCNKPNLTINDIIRILKQNKQKQPTLYELGRRIKKENNNNRIKNELVSAFKKANIKAYVTQYSKTGKETYSIMTFEGNRNSYLSKIIDIWKEEQKINIRDKTDIEIADSIISYDTNNNILINNSKVEEFYQQVVTLNDNPESDDKDYNNLAKKLLNEIGIQLSDSAFSDIISAVTLDSKQFTRYNGTTIKEKFEFDDEKPTGLFSDILHTLRGKSIFDIKDGDESDSTIVAHNPLYVDDKAIRFLGEVESKYSDIITSTHTTVEGKKTYDYLLPTYQYSEFLKAKYDDNYREELANDLFASNSFIFRRIINSDKGSDYTMGLFEAIKNEKSKKGVTRPSMSKRENIMTDFYNFINENKDYANYFDLTKSDKSTSPFHYRVPKIETQQEAYDEYFSIFKAEYTRIQDKDIIPTLSGQLKEGSKYFYLLPQFNYEMMVKLKEQNVITNSDLKSIWEDKDTLNPNITELIESQNYTNTFKSIIDKIINDKVDKFKETIDIQSIPILKGEEKNDELIKEYIYNKHIFNIGLSMFYSGDPASFYKGSGDNIIDNINKTYDQYTKRLAKDIAPGIAGNYANPNYTAVTIKVPNTFTLEYNGLKLKDFYGLKDKKGVLVGQIDPSDASQFCSVKRFFQILYDYGRVPENIYKQIQSRTNVNDSLTEQQMQYISPYKPVEVSRNTANIGNTGQTYSYIHYVKSSLMPLVPNLVNGTSIGKLMELIDKENIDQVSLDTAGKSGNPINIFQPFDIDGNWIHDDNNRNSVLNSKREMKSDGFLIQQELPYNETKEEITFITQLNKLSLDTLTTITENIFNYKGQSLNGEQIALEKEEIRKKILNISFQELREEFGIDEQGNINKQKLVDYIIRTSDDLTINQKEELRLIDNNFVIPLFFNRSSNQIQSKISSAVRKAIQVKINGKSFVQITSLGIGSIDKTGNVPNQIIKTKNWKGDKLRPLRPVIQEIHDSLKVEVYLTQEQLNKGAKGEQFDLTKEQKEYLREFHEEESKGLITEKYSIKILPAEVLVPFNFFDKKGDRIDITKFINDEGEVEIDEEFLKFVGARIPNQSHSSQLPMKIVGFLPAIGGDAMYVPAEITKQMGSDFDIDKMYVYKKKYNSTKGTDNERKQRRTLIKEINNITKEVNAVTGESYTTNNQQSLDILNSRIINLQDRKNNLKQQLKEFEDSLETTEIHSDLSINEYKVKDKQYQEGNIEELKNDYFDILYSILMSPTLFEKIMQPLDMNDLKDVVSKRNDNNKKEIKDLFDPLNQLDSYTSNVGVKALVGTFSLNLTFSVLLQRTKYVRLIKNERTLGNINIGGVELTTFSGLGRSVFKTINKNKEKTEDNRTTSDNIIIPQSETVDHANNQIADKINLNDITANAYAVVLQLKSDKSEAVGNEYASQLINNNVIKTYVNNLRAMRDGFSELKGKDEKKEAYIKTLMDLGIAADKKTKKNLSIKLSDNMLGINRNKEEYIEKITEPLNSDRNNKNILDAFIKLTEIGDEMFQFMIATNFDTKGFGTNLLEGLHKQKLVNKLKSKTTYISGFNELLVKDNEDTELGKTTNLTLNVLNSLSTLFDYDMLNGIMSKITEIKGKEELRPKEIRTIINNFQSFVFSAPVLWDNINGERYRLLYGDDNLTIRLDEIRSKYPEYVLFKKLETKIAKNNNEPNYLVYRTLDIEQDAQYIYNEFFTLSNSTNSELKDFMTDLVKYAYITGGISDYTSFVNLIPPSIVENLLGQDLKEILVSRNFNEDVFIRQYFQNNPEEATVNNTFNKVKNKYGKSVNDLTSLDILYNPIKSDKSDTEKITSLILGEKEVLPKYIYMKGGNREGQKKTFLYELIPNTLNYLQIDTLGDYNSNEYNYNSNYVNSLIPVNQTLNGKHINSKTSVTEKVIITSDSNDEQKIKHNKSLINIINNGRGDLTNTLLLIGQQVNSFKELANILFLNNKQNGFPSAEITINSDGENSYSGKVITLAENSNNMLQMLMHEALHHTTRHYLDNNNNIVTKKLERIKDEVIKALVASKEINTDMLKLYQKAFKSNDRLEAMSEIERIYDKDLSAKQKELYYQLSDINEFVAGAFTNFSFQQILNNIQSNEENENLFTTFKRWIERLVMEIAKNIGIEINDKSALYVTISTVVNNINTEYVESSEKIFFNENDIKEGKELILNCK